MPYEKTLEKQAIDNRARRARERGRIHDVVPGEDRGFSSPRECPIFDELDLDTVGPFTLNYKLSGSELVHAADAGVVTLVTQAETETAVGADLGGFSGSDVGSAVDAGAFDSQEGEITVGIDAGSLLVTFLGTDSAAGADGGVVGISSGDTGSGVDAAGTVIGVSTGDVGSGADTGTVSAGFTDDFNRTGVPMGNGWTANRGSFGCDGSAAYVDSTGFGGDNVQNATQALAQNGTLQVTIAAISPVSGNTGLIFRRSDVSNYLYFGENDFTSTYSVVKVVAGTPTSLFGGSTSPAPGDVLKVVLNFFGFDIYLNGGLLVSITESFNSAEINHGLFADVAVATAAKWDDFSFL